MRPALEDIIDLGCERVLTSGAQRRAIDGVNLIAALVGLAKDRIAVMPGGGIDEKNITAVRAVTGAREFHASAKRVFPSAMRHVAFTGSGMDEGELRSDVEAVGGLAAALRT